jgi:hypothetical protein
MPFLHCCTPTTQSPAMAARVHSCSDSGVVDGSLSRSTSDFSSDSMQTSTPSSANGSVLQMAERRDSSQQQVPLHKTVCSVCVGSLGQSWLWPASA